MGADVAGRRARLMLTLDWACRYDPNVVRHGTRGAVGASRRDSFQGAVMDPRRRRRWGRCSRSRECNHTEERRRNSSVRLVARI